MGEIVIKISNLKKEVQGNVILNNINLEFEKGKIYGLVGKNGSGKSMLFKSICGLLKPSDGEIYILDKAIHKGELSKEIGVIIENPGFIPQYSGMKNLKLLASINNKISDECIKEAIKIVGLDPEDKRPVGKYSLGMKERLGIAQAIMEKPKILVLDEPMNSLDEDGVNLVRELLLKLRNEGVTIILSSHYKEDIKILCDFVYTISNGTIIEK